MKQVIMALLAFGMSVGSFFLASKELSQGHAIVGKYHGQLFTRADSPVAFYLIVGGTCLFGLAMLIASYIFATARDETRKRLLEYADASVFYVRPSIRRLFAALLVFLSVVLVAMFIRQ